MRRRSALILSGNGKAAVARGRYPRHDRLHIRSRHVPWPHTRINRRRATLTERPEYFEFREGPLGALAQTQRMSHIRQYRTLDCN
jgi:hypothetical protein